MTDKLQELGQKVGQSVGRVVGRAQTDRSRHEGPGTTSDPNQADLNTRDPWPDSHADVPERSKGAPQTNPEPARGPGTTSDPNQADVVAERADKEA